MSAAVMVPEARRVYLRDNARERYRRRQRAAGREPAQQFHRCTFCEEPGHNRRNCPKRPGLHSAYTGTGRVIRLEPGVDGDSLARLGAEEANRQARLKVARAISDEKPIEQGQQWRRKVMSGRAWKSRGQGLPAWVQIEKVTTDRLYVWTGHRRRSMSEKQLRSFYRREA